MAGCIVAELCDVTAHRHVPYLTVGRPRNGSPIRIADQVARPVVKVFSDGGLGSGGVVVFPIKACLALYCALIWVYRLDDQIGFGCQK